MIGLDLDWVKIKDHVLFFDDILVRVGFGEVIEKVKS